MAAVVAGLLPFSALARPLPPPPAVGTDEIVWFGTTMAHESLGLPVIEPMQLLAAFAELSPLVGGPITFELRRPHPELGRQVVAQPSDIAAVAERLDAAGLGLADLTAIDCQGALCKLRFEVETRRLDVQGSESLVAWALPVMDRLLATSPLSVRLTAAGRHTRLTVDNRGAEAWLLTDVRVGEWPTERLSRPVAGTLQAVPDGWTIVPGARQVALESVYDGLVVPGGSRSWDLPIPLPKGESCPINLVAYRLADPAVLGGMFLRKKGGGRFEPAAPPWEQWQLTPALMLGAWPPALVVVRQCDLTRR